MIIFWIVLALIIGFLVIILFTDTKLILKYRDGNLAIIIKNTFLRIKINPQRLAEFRKKENKNDKKDEATEENGIFKKIEELKSKYNKSKEMIEVFAECMKYKISFSEIHIYVQYGTGNAATTGMAYGAIWTLIGNVYSYLCRHFSITFPDVVLDADFNGKPVFKADIEGIIKLKFVHIIIATIRSLKIYKKHKKEV